MKILISSIFNKFNFLNFSFKCKRCVNNIQTKLPPENSDCTSDLSQWYHCSNNRGLPDEIISKSWEITKAVSFIFHHRSNKSENEVAPAQQKTSKKSKKNVICSEDEDADEDYEEPDSENDEDYVI